MNAIPQNEPSTALTAFDLSLDMFSMFERMANVMATATVVVPEHCRGKPGNCFPIIMRAHRWRMDPFALANHTFVVGNKIGYEAQAIAAAINTSGMLKDRLNYEWFGEWTKVIGRFVTKESRTKKNEHGEAQTYRAPEWTPEDEEGLGVRVWATLKGENKPRVLEVLLTQARVRNSTLWADDPKQQIAYLAEKKWGRLHTSEVLLGVATAEDLLNGERDMGVVDEVRGEMNDDEPTDTSPSMAGNSGLKQRMRARATTTSTTPPAPPPTPPTLAQVLKAIKDAKDRVELAAAAALAERLKSDKDKEVARTAWDDRREAGRAAARAAKQDEQPEPAAADDVGPDERVEPMKYPEVRAQLEAATDLEEAAVAADLIRFVDPKFQDELRVLYQEIVAKFEGDA